MKLIRSNCEDFKQLKSVTGQYLRVLYAYYYIPVRLHYYNFYSRLLVMVGSKKKEIEK